MYNSLNESEKNKLMYALKKAKDLKIANKVLTEKNLNDFYNMQLDLKTAINIYFYCKKINKNSALIMFNYLYKYILKDVFDVKKFLKYFIVEEDELILADKLEFPYKEVGMVESIDYCDDINDYPEDREIAIKELVVNCLSIISNREIDICYRIEDNLQFANNELPDSIKENFKPIRQFCSDFVGELDYFQDNCIGDVLDVVILNAKAPLKLINLLDSMINGYLYSEGFISECFCENGNIYICLSESILYDPLPLDIAVTILIIGILIKGEYE